jgi:hypothetical protein
MAGIFLIKGKYSYRLLMIISPLPQFLAVKSIITMVNQFFKSRIRLKFLRS